MVQVYKNPENVFSALADVFVAKAEYCINKGRRFSVALAGGSSRKLYELLATETYRKKVKWDNVFFFFGDERYLPLDHADSNYRMVKSVLFDPLHIAADHVFAVNTSLPPADAASDYELKVREHFKNDCRFDLIFLGLGDNSHTASLFPHTSVLQEQVALVKEIFVAEVNMHRITFTAPLINMAHDVTFLVFGAGKALAVKHIIEDPTNIDEYPAQLIKPTQGRLTWFLDEAAASKIKH